MRPSICLCPMKRILSSPLAALPLATALLASSAFAQDPVTIEIKSLAAQMKFDKSEVSVPPGSKVTVVFDNTDEMPHNLVFFSQPGVNANEAVMKMLEKPEQAVASGFVPAEKVLAASKLLNPHEKQTFTFTAPEKSGSYPFACTFPGHALSMVGNLRVMSSGSVFKELSFSVYNGAFEKLPDFTKLTPHRSGKVEGGLIHLNFDDYKNQYAMVFEGVLEAPANSDYTFYLASDDGGRVIVDGEKVLEHDGIHPASVREKKKKLSKGEHKVRVEYFQAAGGAELYVGWGGPFDVTALSKWTPPGYKRPQASKGDENVGMPIEVKDEVVIYRNFLTGVGNRGIAVGYPGGLSVAWSAESFSPVLMWRGAFMDAARHWRNRGGGAQPPAGYDVVRPIDVSLPFAVAADGKPQWSKHEFGAESEGYQWRGYRLDPKGAPTFRYGWNGAEIEEAFEAKGGAMDVKSGLVRRIKVSGKMPQNAYLRIANGTVTQDGEWFIVRNGMVDLGGGRRSENAVRVRVKGGRTDGTNVFVPVSAALEAEYGWVPVGLPGGNVPKL